MRAGDVVASRFRLERLAGAGGMGSVFRALDLATGDVVAVKMMLGAGGDARRFLREASVLAEVSHPRVVRHVAHGESESGAPYLAMEWLEGEDLASRLARGPLGLDEAVRLGALVAEALGAVHARSLVHRDVKPSNVFLRGGAVDDAVLVDFGIARRGQRVTAVTATGVMLGTPGYMAPEQARGDRDVDARADLYALGCVIFECVSGRAPFVAEHVMALLAKILLEEAPRVAELVPAVPGALDELLARLLRKDRHARPSSAAEVERALGSLLDEVGSPALAETCRSGETITGGELRLVCVVLASEDAGAVTLDPTITPGESEARAAALAALSERFAARIEALPGGTLLAVVAGEATATDQAERAALLAVELEAAFGFARVAVVTGQGQTTRRLPVGEAIDRAVTLQRATEGHAGVFLDEVTGALLEPRFDVVPAEGGRRRLAGRKGPTTARTLLGRETPCVGRDREIGNLTALMRECFDEPGARVVLVTAAAGVGKTRLGHELLRAIRGRTADVWTAYGQPMGAGSPFAFVTQLVRAATGALAGEAPELQRSKLRAAIEGGPVSRLVALFLSELLGVTLPSDEAGIELAAARNDARLMGDQLRSAFEGLVGARLRRGPVALVLDDLQWGDGSSVHAIDQLLRVHHERPLFVVALARPEVHDTFARLWAARGLSEERLRPLPKRAAEQLVREVLGDRADAVTVGRVVELAGGNAFYLEESIRAASEGRGLPASLVAMVQGRLSALAPHERKVLRAAAVFGPTFWAAGVERLLGAATARATDGGVFAKLVAQEVIAPRSPSRFSAAREYTFRHALLHEAAYATLTADDRVVGHRLAGTWLEEAGERDSSLLAEHFLLGGATSRAIELLSRAASEALEGNDLEGAIRLARRGAELGADGQLRGKLLAVEAEAHGWRGDFADLRRCGDEARAHLLPGSREWFVAVGFCVFGRGRPRELLMTIAREVLEASELAGAFGGRVYALNCVHRAAFAIGEAGLAAEAAAALEAVVATRAVELEGDLVAKGWAYAALADRAHFQGDAARAIGLLQRATEAVERTGNRREAMAFRLTLGDMLKELGAYEQAERILRDAADEGDRLGVSANARIARINLSIAVAGQGRFSEATTILDQLGAAREVRRRSVGLVAMYRARIELLAGRPERAETSAKDAFVPGQSVEADDPRLALALALVALAQVGQSKPVEALAAATESLAILERVGVVEEGEALILLAHAAALRADDRRDEARVAAARAAARLRARASTITDEALRSSFLERVWEHRWTLELAAELGVAGGERRIS